MFLVRKLNRTAILLSAVLPAAVALVLVSLHAPGLPGREIPVTSVDGSAPLDFSDDRQVAFVSDEIFIGRVIEQSGDQGIATDGGNTIPQTQYTVQILQNIKGQVSGNVMVNQDGGYDRSADGVRLVLFNKDPLLLPDQTYLFAVEKSTLPIGGYAIVGEGYGDIRIDNAQQLQKLVERFQRASAKEVDPFADGEV